MIGPKSKTSLLLLLLMALLSGLVGCERQGEKRQQVRQEERMREKPQQEQYEGVIVAMGDSLTAGLGVAEAEAYPARLAARLREAGFNYRVINAGVSGETSRGALERTPWILSFKPDIVILETGANDGLRGIAPEAIRENLEKIIAAFREEGVVVVLCGMEMVRNLGESYTAAFRAIYPAVARREGVIFMPFFLQGVAGEPELNQPDTIHPTAAGYRRIVENLLPYVKQAIAASRNKGGV